LYLIEKMATKLLKKVSVRENEVEQHLLKFKTVFEWQGEYHYIRLVKKSIRLPTKKTSWKRRRMEKLYDCVENFVSKKLHGVNKRLKKIHSRMVISLQTDTEEAKLLKKGKDETNEEFDSKCNNIFRMLTDIKEKIEFTNYEVPQCNTTGTVNTKYVHFLLKKVKEVFDFKEEVKDNEDNLVKEDKDNEDNLVKEEDKDNDNNLAKEEDKGAAMEKLVKIAREDPTKKQNSSEMAATENERKYPKCCWFCGEEEGRLLKCSGCKKAYYCKRDCIERDWSVHGNWCNKRQKRRAERKSKN